MLATAKAGIAGRHLGFDLLDSTGQARHIVPVRLQFFEVFVDHFTNDPARGAGHGNLKVFQQPVVPAGPIVSHSSISVDNTLCYDIAWEKLAWELKLPHTHIMWRGN